MKLTHYLRDRVRALVDADIPKADDIGKPEFAALIERALKDRPDLLPPAIQRLRRDEALCAHLNSCEVTTRRNYVEELGTNVRLFVIVSGLRAPLEVNELGDEVVAAADELVKQRVAARIVRHNALSAVRAALNGATTVKQAISNLPILEPYFERCVSLEKSTPAQADSALSVLQKAGWGMAKTEEKPKKKPKQK